jgi:hypothetical protein
MNQFAPTNNQQVISQVRFFNLLGSSAMQTNQQVISLVRLFNLLLEILLRTNQKGDFQMEGQEIEVGQLGYKDI